MKTASSHTWRRDVLWGVAFLGASYLWVLGVSFLLGPPSGDFFISRQTDQPLRWICVGALSPSLNEKPPNVDSGIWEKRNEVLLIWEDKEGLRQFRGYEKPSAPIPPENLTFSPGIVIPAFEATPREHLFVNDSAEGSDLKYVEHSEDHPAMYVLINDSELMLFCYKVLHLYSIRDGAPVTLFLSEWPMFNYWISPDYMEIVCVYFSGASVYRWDGGRYASAPKEKLNQAGLLTLYAGRLWFIAAFASNAWTLVGIAGVWLIAILRRLIASRRPTNRNRQIGVVPMGCLVLMALCSILFNGLLGSVGTLRWNLVAVGLAGVGFCFFAFAALRFGVFGGMVPVIEAESRIKSENSGENEAR